MPKTLYDKVWDAHRILDDGEESLIYIDRHLIHEVTTPQAFEAMRLHGRHIHRPTSALAVTDHCVPTSHRDQPLKDDIARLQVSTLQTNCRDACIRLYDLDSEHQGIVHVVAPEMGYILPGMTVVCGDSHTSTHGALGTLAFGIGTSEIEHVLGTQTLRKRKSKNMLVRIDGALKEGVTPKDVVLALIGEIGVDRGTGHVIEYQGSLIDSLSIEGRMTLTNMTIEAGATSGMIAPDEQLFAYLKGKPYTPTGDMWDRAMAYWRTLKSDVNAKFDEVIHFDARVVVPQVSWGTTPEQVVPIHGVVPSPGSFRETAKRVSCQNALRYMGLEPGTAIQSIAVDVVFIGSCTNSRIEDLRT